MMNIKQRLNIKAAFQRILTMLLFYLLAGHVNIMHRSFVFNVLKSEGLHGDLRNLAETQASFSAGQVSVVISHAPPALLGWQ